MAENGTEFIIASGFTATKPNSPIKAAIKWGSNNILDGLTSIPFIGNLSENSYRVYAVLLIVIAIGLIFLCLRNVVSNMKSLMMNQIEMGLDRALARGGGLICNFDRYSYYFLSSEFKYHNIYTCSNCWFRHIIHTKCISHNAWR